jgi:tight adherence protein B
MGSFALVLILIWLLSVGIWFVVSRTAQKTDIDKVKNRLLGSPQKKAKAVKKGGPVQLINQDEQPAGKLFVKLLEKYKLVERLKELIEQAGLKWNATRTIHGCLTLGLVTYGIFWLVLPPQFRRFALPPAVGAGAIPILYLSRLRKRRLFKFEEQFPESLEFVARSMRAGHAFTVSLEMIHHEFQEPLAGEFKRTFEESNLGLPIEVALQKLAKRVPSLDVHFFVSAVLLQKRTGGNLAEILDKLAALIRERFKLRGKIRAVSAHGRMTGMALSSIPAGVAGIMFYVNPDYVKFFITDETGNVMIAAAVLLQIFGYLVIKKIVTIEV